MAAGCKQEANKGIQGSNKNSPSQTNRAAFVNKPTNFLPAFTTRKFSILTQIGF
jgi:hypothetical protein